MSDLFCNPGGDYIFLRISGIYLRRKQGLGWSVIAKEQASDVINWSPLHYKQFDTLVPYLIKEGLLPENVEFSGERPAPKKASEQGLDAATNE